MKDKLIVVNGGADVRWMYGMVCSWNGPISETKTDKEGHPVCPHCQFRLYEYQDREQFYKWVLDFSVKIDEPLFPDFTDWLHTCGVCWNQANGDLFSSLLLAYKGGRLHIEI